MLLAVLLLQFGLTFGPLNLVYAQTAVFEKQASKQQSNMRKAIQLIQLHDYALARSYLDAVLISPFISNTQRSRGYYFRGFSYFSQNLFVSAAQDYARSLEFDPGNKSTLSAVAHLYSQGLGTKKDLALAFEYFLKAARAGHQFSQYSVGLAYLAGQGVVANRKKARYWFESSTSGNNGERDSYAPAYVQLAATYRSEPEPDVNMAENLYQKAVALGSADALVGLAYMHLNGEFNEAGNENPNLDLAADYFRQAAGAGSSAGQAGLGYLYQTGQGLKHSEQQAVKWYTRAAKAGNDFAQLRLGEIILKNPSLENSRMALVWFEKAARQGMLNARNSVAWLLATSKHEELRNGKQAIEIAKIVVVGNSNPSYLDTLAAALAENGDFDSAISAQEQAIEKLANPEELTSLKYKERLSAYKNGQPWRE